MSCKHSLGMVGDYLLCSSRKVKSSKKHEMGHLVSPRLCKGICPYINHGEDGKPTRGSQFPTYVHTDSPLPSLFVRSANYISSLADHVAGGSVLVSDEVKSHRRKKCDQCQYRNREHDACSLCGCQLNKTAIGDKLAWATSRCFNWEKSGVAIGCYNLPKLAELQIQVIADKCGPVPILLCDDTKPGTDRQQAIADLAKKYPNVKYWGNPENYGHHRGDASCFWKAIQWGKIEGLEVVCKLSMRHIINIDNWLKDSSKAFLESGHATGASGCIDNDTRLFIRSECVLLNVAKWFDSGAYKELQGRNSYAPVVELHYNHIMCQYFGVMQWNDEKGACEMGQRWLWPLMNERRNRRVDGIIWHCSNTEDEYRELAEKYKLKLDDDFHCAGSEQRRGYASSYKIG